MRRLCQRLPVRLASQSAMLATSARWYASSPREPMTPWSQGNEPGMRGSVEATEDTHPDFQPRLVDSDVTSDEIEMIKKDVRETIQDDSVVIFIKGIPEAPMCGFSAKLVDIVETLGVEYTSFDVLAHPVLRTYVKELSEWPTIPQLFVKGEFAGGLDIILAMAENGDLQKLLDEKGIVHRFQNNDKKN